MVTINLQKYLMENRLINKVELGARLATAMIKNEPLLLKTKEGKSFQSCGFYEELDNLCKIFNYSKSKIVIESNNWTEKHSEYTVRIAPFSLEFSYFNKENLEVSEYSGKKFYGLFVGRADVNRLRSLVLSRRLSIPCLTSLNQDVDTFNMDFLVEVGYLIKKTDTTSEEINSLIAHSDIGKVIEPPICPPENSFGWKNVYRDIAIEIVNETTLYPRSFHITEKTLRPMYYKRPFIMIGAEGYLENLRKLGFKTFNNILPNHDKIKCNPDLAFIELQKLHNTYTGNQILSLCKDQLESNYELLIEIGKKHKDISDELKGLEYFDK